MAWHRQHQVTGWAPPLTYGRLSEATGAEPISISTAIKRLIGLGVLAVQPGAGSKASIYPCHAQVRHSARA
jgi:hypothetical protein